jgi:hypothetical protein
MQITISDATITAADGTVTKATITGEAQIAEPVPPSEGDLHPSHPINLPPTSDNPDVFFVLSYCKNPPPPHWEWIGFLPGEEVPERPTPQPPPATTPPGFKPPPANGGWGYWPGYGWVYYPAKGEASPKRR